MSWGQTHAKEPTVTVVVQVPEKDVRVVWAIANGVAEVTGSDGWQRFCGAVASALREKATGQGDAPTQQTFVLRYGHDGAHVDGEGKEFR